MAEKITLTDIERDALKETANVGAGNASSALSEMVNRRVDIVVSDLNFVSLDDLQKIIGGPQKLVVGIYTPVSGDMSGTVIVIFPIESAIDLSSALQRKKSTSSKIISKEDQEALVKMGNILCDSYLGSLIGFLEITIKRENSKIISTFGESVADLFMLSISSDYTQGLLIKTDFSIEKSDIDGKFVLLLATKKIDKILRKIKEKIG